MGLGLQFVGRPAPRGLLRRRPSFAKWTVDLIETLDAIHEGFVERIHLAEDDPNYTELFLHPAAEPVVIKHDGKGRIQVAARTSGVGAGYHLFLLESLLAFFERSKFELEVQSAECFDECGVWPDGDPKNAWREMETWRRAMAKLAVDAIADGSNQFNISMRMDCSFETPGDALTPLGPRSRHWLESVVNGHSDGADIEAWSDPGFNARYWRGRALSHMWLDVCWRKPLNEQEEDLLKTVQRELLSAFEIDPTLPLPVREWRELQVLAPKIIEIPLNPIEMKEPGSIGYRRCQVKHRWFGWCFTAPGEFAREIEDDGSTLHLRDETRSVFFSSFDSSNEDDTSTASESLLQRDIPYGGFPVDLNPKPGVFANAFITQKNNVRVFSGQAAVNGKIGRMTVAYPKIGDDTWATSLFETLQHEG